MESEFDAYDYAKDLESTGVPQEQAQAYARILNRVHDRLVLGRELDMLRTEFLPRLKAFKAEVDATVASLETALEMKDLHFQKPEPELKPQQSDQQSHQIFIADHGDPAP